MSVTFASAHATAWQKLKSSVRLQWMPCFDSSSRAAWIPSHVDAILISTRSREIPTDSYSSISLMALSIVARVSNDRRASTSVDTRPGMILRISSPNDTSRRSTACSTISWRLWPWALAYSTAGATILAYFSSFTAARISDGFVVASCGLYTAIDSKSPESETTVVNCFSDARAFDMEDTGPCTTFATGPLQTGRGRGSTASRVACQRSSARQRRHQRRLGIVMSARQGLGHTAPCAFTQAKGGQTVWRRRCLCVR